MKLLLDRARELTNIYKLEDLPQTSRITHTPADFWRAHYNGDFDSEILPNVKTKEVKTLQDAVAQFNEIVHVFSNHPDRYMKLDLDEPIKRKILKPIEKIELQKTTYEAAKDEDFKKIVDTFSSMQSGAPLRAIEVDEKNRRITVYAATYGLWNVNGEHFVKNSEAASRRENKVRMQFTLRDLRHPENLTAEPGRLDFQIFEDLNALFSAGAIEKLEKPTEQLDGSWKTDPQYTILPLHFKAELTEEELKSLETRAEAKKKVTEEVSHVGKGQATKEQTKETVERNEKEIHTTYDVEAAEVPKKEPETAKKELKEGEEAQAPAEEKKLAENPLVQIREQKEKAIHDFFVRQLKELEEKQRRELEEMKIKIEQAEADRNAAKVLYVRSLANGNTIEEGVEHLRAAKFNDVTIAAALEEVKADMLLAVEKDRIIEEKEKQAEKLSSELERVGKKLEESERARKTNHERMLKEVEKRKEIEAKVGKLIEATEKLKSKIVSQSAEIRDLQEEVQEKDRTIEEMERQLEQSEKEKEELRAKATQTFKEQKVEIEALKAKVAELEKKAESQSREIERKDEQIEEKDKMIGKAEEREKTLMSNLQEAQSQVKSFASILEEIRKENAELRAKIEALAGVKEEVEAIKQELKEAREENVQLRQVTEKAEEQAATSIDELERLAAEALGKRQSADNSAIDTESE